jgi:hypothetical protein
VLDVMLRKVREIKKATGINVPFPEDSKSIIDTITQSLLLNPDRKISTRRSDVNQIEFNFEEFDEARKLELEVSDKYKKAADRASQSRSIFAQHAIKAEEIEQDLRENDEAIGSPQVVENYVVDGLRSLFGVQIDREKSGYLLYTANLPQSVKTLLPAKSSVKVSFESPTPEDHIIANGGLPMHTFADLAKALNRSTVYLSGLQTRFDLPTFDGACYSEAYLAFLQTLVHLRTLSITEETLRDLWHIEKKLLVLLHADSTGSPTWFLDSCGATTCPKRRLLLTNYELGAEVQGKGVQLSLNFADTAPELFAGQEMGEDALRVLNDYRKLYARISAEVKAEVPHLRAAVAWSKRV